MARTITSRNGNGVARRSPADQRSTGLVRYRLGRRLTQSFACHRSRRFAYGLRAACVFLPVLRLAHGRRLRVDPSRSTQRLAQLSMRCRVPLRHHESEQSHRFNASRHVGFDQCTGTGSGIVAVHIGFTHVSEITSKATASERACFCLSDASASREGAPIGDTRLEQAIELPGVTRFSAGRAASSSAYLTYGPPNFGGSLRWAGKGGGT
jgi:hypothetical protein